MKKGLKVFGVALLMLTLVTGCDNSNKDKTIATMQDAYKVAQDNGYSGTFEEFVILIKGEKGDKGDQGEAGVSITKIFKSNTEGLVDTYTIVYSNGTTSEFKVTNGSSGIQGIQGVPGQDGKTPVITIGKNGNWFIDGVDTKQPSKGEAGLSAYELYVKYHPEYKGTEAEWVEEFFGEQTRCEHQYINEYDAPRYLKRSGDTVFFAYDLDCLLCGKKITKVDSRCPMYVNKYYVEYKVLGQSVDAQFIDYNSTEKFEMLETETIGKIVEIDGKFYRFQGWDQTITTVDKDYVVNAILEEVAPEDLKMLKVWCSYDDESFMKSVINNFKIEYPQYNEYQIVLELVNEPDAAPALKADPNASADVFHFTGDSLGELVRQDLLYPIDSSFLTGNGINEKVLTSGQVNGQQYGIPFTPNAYFMFYDASVYTAEDVKSFEKMIAVDVSKHGYDYNFALDIANGWYLQSYFLSNGCTMYEEGKEAISPRDKGLHAAKWMWDYYHNDKLYPADGSAECGYRNAACVTGTWNAGTIKENIESNGGTYAAAPLPACDFGDGVVPWKSVGDFKHVGVNSVTREPELSCLLASYITNAESQKLRYEMRQTAPTNEKTLLDTTIDWDPSIIAQTEQLKATFQQPLGHSDHNFWDSATAFGSDLQGAREYEIEDWFDKFVESITIRPC